MKKLISFLLLCSTICFSDLITTFEFDVEESSIFQFNRPNWDESNDTFYYNLAYFTVDTEGDWRAANTSILSHDSFDYSNYQTQFTNNPWFAADTYIYLYENTFDVSDPKKNLIAEDDDSYDGGNSVQFDLTYNLQTNTIQTIFRDSGNPGTSVFNWRKEFLSSVSDSIKNKGAG